MIDVPALVAAIGGTASTLIAAFGFGQRQRGLRAETDVKLSRAFAELVPIANARGPGVFSDTAAGKLAECDYETPEARRQALKDAVITSPVGSATQVAVLQAVASLGREHPLLWSASKAAVESVELDPEFERHRGAALTELGDSPRRRLGEARRRQASG